MASEYYAYLNKIKNDSLKHYNIKGSHWGQRRWQNEDGTFNEEGKLRYFGKKAADTVKGAAVLGVATAGAPLLLAYGAGKAIKNAITAPLFYKKNFDNNGKLNEEGKKLFNNGSKKDRDKILKMIVSQDGEHDFQIKNGDTSVNVVDRGKDYLRGYGTKKELENARNERLSYILDKVGDYKLKDYDTSGKKNDDYKYLNYLLGADNMDDLMDYNDKFANAYYYGPNDEEKYSRY